MLARVALDGYADDAARLFFGLEFGVVEDMAGEVIGVAQGLLLDFLEEFCARFGFVHSGQLLQLFEALARQFGEFAFLLFDHFGPFAQGRSLFLQILFRFDDALELRVNECLAFAQALFQFGPLGAAGGKGLLDLRAQFESFLVGGQAGVAPNHLRFAVGFGRQRLGFESFDLLEAAILPPQQQVAQYHAAHQEDGVFNDIDPRAHSKTARRLQLDPARRRQDAIYRNVLRSDWKAINDLFIESHSASRSAHDRQQLVIKPFTPAQAAALQIES